MLPGPHIILHYRTNFTSLWYKLFFYLLHLRLVPRNGLLQVWITFWIRIWLKFHWSIPGASWSRPRDARFLHHGSSLDYRAVSVVAVWSTGPLELFLFYQTPHLHHVQHLKGIMLLGDRLVVCNIHSIRASIIVTLVLNRKPVENHQITLYICRRNYQGEWFML